MPPASGDRPRVGKVLAGKYRLDQLLGAGGMGEVYRAENLLIGRTVAIKLLLAVHTENHDIVTRFLREARAANIVRHSNVVDVLDMGRDDDGVPFIVQEFLEGEDLGHHLDRIGGRLDLASALDVMIPVAEAVALAHSKGVVHRDLKPENIFLARTDRGMIPKVLDFGISKIAAGPAESRVTATGVAIGTPAYMSPEQIKASRAIDARADVWSLGVIVHEVLAGSLPFDAESPGALFVEICTAAPIPLEQAAPGMPRDIASVVARCLRRDADERYPTASELARDLRNVRESRAIEPTGPHAVPRETDAPRPVAFDAREAMPTVGPASARLLDRAPTALATDNIATMARPAVGPRDNANVVRPARPMPARSFTPPPTGSALMDLAIAAAMTFVAAAIARAVVSIVTPGHRWPVLELAIRLLTARSVPMLGASALVLAGVALVLGVKGVRASPTSWGHVVCGAGFLALTYFVISAAIVISLPDNASLDPLRGTNLRLLPWTSAMVPFGLGIVAIRAAISRFTDSDRPSRTNALVLGAVAVACFFVAVNVVRGFDADVPAIGSDGERGTGRVTSTS